MHGPLFPSDRFAARTFVSLPVARSDGRDGVILVPMVSSYFQSERFMRVCSTQAVWAVLWASDGFKALIVLGSFTRV